MSWDRMRGPRTDHLRVCGVGMDTSVRAATPRDTASRQKAEGSLLPSAAGLSTLPRHAKGLDNVSAFAPA